jgi:hypothetical protein
MRNVPSRRLIHLAIMAIVVFWPGLAMAAGSGPANFPPPISSYGDNGSTLWQTLTGRIAAEPFNLAATVIFLLAITHTFLAAKFLAISHRYEREFQALERKEHSEEDTRGVARRLDRLRFRAMLCHFFGEVEAVFGIWVIPLAIAIVVFHGWSTMVHYIDGVNYTEPIFVFVVMAIASSKPILRVAERCLSLFASLGGGSPAAWWVSILTIGPLLGSFITEPAAMTICALLLLERFYQLKPPMTLRYATLGLLFVNISVGGTLTHFAAPPVVMVASAWNWGFAHMLEEFGWKAAVGIIAANILYFAVFRAQLLALKPHEASNTADRPVPPFITLTHLLAIAWTVLNAHHVALILLGLLFFLAFTVATDRHQSPLNLRSPLLVGFFLAALVIHGGCQQWWIAPVLGGLTRWPLMVGSTLLTALNDNAAITYLATLVPGFTDELKHAVVAGAVTGGGLTVIANAPNPAGQSILQSQFGPDGIKPLGLFLAALAPTVIVGAALMLLP